MPQVPDLASNPLHRKGWGFCVAPMMDWTDKEKRAKHIKCLALHGKVAYDDCGPGLPCQLERLFLCLGPAGIKVIGQVLQVHTLGSLLR